MKHFIELKVWRSSIDLIGDIYTASKSFPREELFGLVSQMRRCAVSVSANIAEGCGRNHRRDSTRFFYIARGSLYELETYVYISENQAYFTKEQKDSFLEKIVEIRKMINGLINYFEKQIQNS